MEDEGGMTIGSEGAGGGRVAASGGAAVEAASPSSSTLSCPPSSFPSSLSLSFSSSSAKKEAKSATLIKSRPASLNKTVEDRTGPGAGGGGSSRGGMSARLAMVLSPCTAAPGENSGRFVPRGEGAWRGDCCPLRPNGARVAGGGMGSVQEEEGEEWGAGSG